MATPELVSSFRFVTPENIGESSTSHRKSARDVDLEVQAGLKHWEGRSIFSTTTPKKTPRSGSATSPISLSPSPTDLPRPRAVPKYSSPLPRTAFSPPRAAPSQSTSKSKPIHPFFERARSIPAPPPASLRPRLVAHYSSTSDSGKTGSQETASTCESYSERWMMRDSEIELLAEEVGRLGIGSGRSGVPNRIRTEQENEEIVQLGVEIPARRPLANAQTVPTRQPPISLPSSKPPNSTTIPRAKPPPQPSNLPPFHHRNYLPNTRPRVVYTTTSAEADDLLSCLRGPVLGFDLEWPVSGKYRTVGADGRAVEQRVGMKWTANGWGYEQARTALVQFCDERLVVLVHLRDMEELPNKVVEILQDPTIFKTGVQIRGDGLKLLRDFPKSFPTGIHSLLELSQLARRVDPIGTGPGATLISLVNLGRAYLGREIDKDVGVRKGNWTKRLDPKQIDYAANDVFASLHIYLALARRAERELDTREFCANLGRTAVAPETSGATTTQAALGINGPIPSGIGGPRPSELRALEKFVAGITTDAIALDGGIKTATIQGYICKALEVLPPDTFDIEQKKRFLYEIPAGAYILKHHRHLVRGLRKEVGDVVSDSEEEAIEGEGGL